MRAWLRLAAPIALALSASPAAALQSGGAQPTLDYAQIVSATQDCLDSFKTVTIDPKQLRKRGWTKARMDGFGGLEQVMTAFVRKDGAVMLVMQTTCIVKARLAPPASADGLAAAMSERWALQPTPGVNGVHVWRLPQRKIELTPGPADGSNVSVTASALFGGAE